MLGKPLMEWQQYVADVLLEIDPETGELAYNEWLLTVPRQSGKTTFLLAKNSHRCMATGFFGPNQQIAYAAQTQKKATEKFEKDYALAISQAKRGHPQLRQIRVRTGNQKVDIRYPNGSVWAVESGTEKSGHGSTLDSADVDEAFAQPDNRLEQAFTPAMVTRRNRQFGAVSTAGWSDSSPYLWAKVQIGRKAVANGVRKGFAYFEWSAPEDAEPGDESVWLDCMPAVHRPDCLRDCGRHTIRIEVIRAEYDKAVRENKLSDFSRAFLNQWKPKPREGEETALGNWAACERILREMPDLRTLGAAISKDRDGASVGGCGFLDDELPLVSLVERRNGVDWVAPFVADLSRSLDIAVTVDIGGPSGESLADAVESLGGRVVRYRLPEYVEACSEIFDRVASKRLAHPGDADLNASVIGARWRSVGDGRRVFGRKASEADVAPLESITLALHAALEARVGPSAYFL